MIVCVCASASFVSIPVRYSWLVGWLVGYSIIHTVCLLVIGHHHSCPISLFLLLREISTMFMPKGPDDDFLDLANLPQPPAAGHVAYDRDEVPLKA
jgi:hypothetical protein